jgi:hypothetical protein
LHQNDRVFQRFSGDKVLQKTLQETGVSSTRDIDRQFTEGFYESFPYRIRKTFLYIFSIHWWNASVCLMTAFHNINFTNRLSGVYASKPPSFSYQLPYYNVV